MPTFNLEVSLSNTIDWISNNKVKELRSNWYSKAKKL